MHPQAQCGPWAMGSKRLRPAQRCLECATSFGEHAGHSLSCGGLCGQAQASTCNGHWKASKIDGPNLKQIFCGVWLGASAAGFCPRVASLLGDLLAKFGQTPAHRLCADDMLITLHCLPAMPPARGCAALEQTPPTCTLRKCWRGLTSAAQGVALALTIH